MPKINPHVLILYWQTPLVVSKIWITLKLVVSFSQTNCYCSKETFSKKKPKVVLHQQYKHFRNYNLRIELQNMLLKYDINNIDYNNFIKTFLTVLDKHAPLQKKCLTTNHANFMTKQLRKAVMKRSKLRNDFLK